MSAPILLAGPNGQVFGARAPRVFELDGHRFDERSIASHPAALAMIFIAQKARAGDPEAVRFATAFDLNVRDSAGNMFWPIGSPPSAAAEPAAVAA